MAVNGINSLAKTIEEEKDLSLTNEEFIALV